MTNSVVLHVLKVCSDVRATMSPDISYCVIPADRQHSKYYRHVISSGNLIGTKLAAISSNGDTMNKLKQWLSNTAT